MEIMNYQEITMESETFSKIRESFNLLLQRLFQKMEQNHSDEGAITLKINLSISTDFIPDGNGSSREVHKPVLKYKIDTQVPVKDGFDGKNDTGMELVYDDELKRYVLKYVSEGGQQSIFDQKGYPDGIPCNKQTAEAWGLQEGDLFKCEPYLQISTVDGSHAMWVPSIRDCLAEDWYFADK